MEDDISSKVLNFADDTKVFRKVTNDTDKQSLQDDLEKLVKWSENGKCYSILGSVHVYTYDMETWTKNIKWGMLY